MKPPALVKGLGKGIRAEVGLQAGYLHGLHLTGISCLRSNFRKRRQPLHKD